LQVPVDAARWLEGDGGRVVGMYRVINPEKRTRVA
jgi:hypothetical protein